MPKLLNNKILIIGLWIQLSASCLTYAAAIVDSPATVDSFGINSLECSAFAVEYSGGKFEVYSRPARSTAGYWKIKNSLIDAMVSNTGGECWQLELTPNKAIEKVWFPWWKETLVESRRSANYALYYPYLLGTVMRSDFNKPFAWWGVEYPGTAFAPVMVLSSDQEALMVAAANWPPKRTKVYYSYLRMSFLYDEQIKPNQTATFRAITCKAAGDISQGTDAWHTVVDQYKTWLKTKMEEAELLPINYPQWMKDVDGFMNVQLQNMPQFNIAEIYNSWNQWHSVFPWIQFWGQMSDYAGKQGGGCCLEKQEMHPRYKPDLIQFVRNVTTAPAQPGHVGYYSRPRESDDDIVDNTTARNFLLGWLQKNESDYNANIFYVDVLGNRYFGDPLRVATLFRDEFPKDIFIEYPVDIYPTAFLVSGSLGGNQYKNTDWAQRVDGLTTKKKKAAYPAFGRYLLDDRVILMGESNGDHIFWGTKGQHWTERQAFLLGAKFDVTTFSLGKQKEAVALEMILSERKRVSWWQRQPVYCDTKGLSDIPAGIQVRRFKDKDDKDLFVIDNWNRLSSRRFNFNNQTISVPEKQLSILEIN